MSKLETDTLTLPAGGPPFLLDETARADPLRVPGKPEDIRHQDLRQPEFRQPERKPQEIRPNEIKPRPFDDVDTSAESLRRAALVSGGRNPVFALMVENEDDIAGLVAYALYKQSKRDWMMEFATRNGRNPNDDEIDSYILGERTPRRVATYRKLASDELERFRASGHVATSLIGTPPPASPHAPASVQPPARTIGDQIQFFVVSAAIGAILTLIAIYAAPRLLYG